MRKKTGSPEEPQDFSPTRLTSACTIITMMPLIQPHILQLRTNLPPLRTPAPVQLICLYVVWHIATFYFWQILSLRLLGKVPLPPILIVSAQPQGLSVPFLLIRPTSAAAAVFFSAQTSPAKPSQHSQEVHGTTHIKDTHRSTWTFPCFVCYFHVLDRFLYYS